MPQQQQPGAASTLRGGATSAAAAAAAGPATHPGDLPLLSELSPNALGAMAAALATSVNAGAGGAQAQHAQQAAGGQPLSVQSRAALMQLNLSALVGGADAASLAVAAAVAAPPPGALFGGGGGGGGGGEGGGGGGLVVGGGSVFDASVGSGDAVGGWGAGAGGTAWRPRGVLVAHMMEHRRAVTQVRAVRVSARVSARCARLGRLGVPRCRSMVW